MYHNNDFIYDAIFQLEQLIDIPIDIDSSRKKYDAILSIRNQQFIVEAKSAVRTSNQGLILSQLEELKQNSNRPIILIAKYISKTAAAELKIREINYIDIAGNAYINNNGITIFVEGQKRKSKQKTNQSRAFQEAGIKIIFYLLRSPENLQHSYREIAENANVSIGSVSNVMAELVDLNYLIKTKEKRVLKNKPELLERWIVAFNTVLRPRIVRKKMRFINPNIANEWRNVDLNIYESYDLWDGESSGKILWGGEPGSAILTGGLRPEKFILFTNYDLPILAKTLQLVPDPKGNVEILRKFWKGDKENTNIAPALIIYAELINSSFGRNIEIAKQILENELQYI